jgi:hypothetical protein
MAQPLLLQAAVGAGGVAVAAGSCVVGSSVAQLLVQASVGVAGAADSSSVAHLRGGLSRHDHFARRALPHADNLPPFAFLLSTAASLTRAVSLPPPRLRTGHLQALLAQDDGRVE